MKAFLLVILVTPLLGANLCSQEWNRFRGPNGSGIGQIKGLPVEIASVDYEWAAKIEGFGHSSPVLWGDKLFITATDGEHETAAERYVLCYHARNGELLWKWKDSLESHNLHKFNNFASSTPVVDGQRVYLVWGSGSESQAVAISQTGELVWRKTWPAFSSDHGQGTSPVIVDGKVIFHTDSKDAGKSYVVALDPASGEVLWQVERLSPATEKHLTAYNTPVTMPWNGGQCLVVHQSNDGWRGIDPGTGEELWKAPHGSAFRSVGSAATSGGFMFASFGSGGAGKDAIALRVADGKVTLLYHLGIKDGLSYVPTPLIFGNLIYLWGDGGVITCREMETGAEVFRDRVGGNFFSSPVIADGKIINANREGELVMIELSDKFNLLGRSRLEGEIQATPAIANNCLYVRTASRLVCISGK